MKKSKKKKLKARLAELEAKLDANLAHFPERVLKTRYKKAYENLVDEIKEIKEVLGRN